MVQVQGDGNTEEGNRFTMSHMSYGAVDPKCPLNLPTPRGPRQSVYYG